MLVTLPFVLLLLDYWPLRRFGGEAAARGGLPLPPLRLVVEKVPLLLLAAASSVVTWRVQEAGGAVSAFDRLPLGSRIANAVVAYVTYLADALRPTRLGVLYPYPDAVAAWKVLAAGAVLAAITVVVLRAARRAPYLAVGWLWYLGTLVPVIGLVQVGVQSHADRYTYVPLIGAFAMAAWGVRDLVIARPALLRPVAVTTAAALAACAGWTIVQSRPWRTSETLFEQSLRVAPWSELIHTNYGALLARAGRPADARRQYDAALRTNPRFTPARFNLVALLIDTGELDGAALELERIVAGSPRSATARHQLGTVRARQGRLDEAAGHFRAAHTLAPADPRPIEDLGLALLASGRADVAASELTAVLSGGPRSAQIYYLLGVAESERGRLAAAVPAFESALRLDPRHVPALNRLGVALAQQGRLPEAIARFRAALDADPGSAEARENLRRAEGMIN
jgi:tetratricopeptide (TPR) repeat protein